MFPIMGVATYRIDEDVRALRTASCTMLVIQIPFAMIAPHNQQAVRNHSQDLLRLAERGGLSPEEACAVLEDRGYYDVRLSKAEGHMRLIRHLQVWKAKHAAEADGL